MKYLAIRYIEDTNPTWFRPELGPMEDLTADIKRHGVKVPVLLRSDFLLIDGARRVVAAKNLGLETVPVQICNGWADVLQYFRPAEPDCYPMDWLTLLEFWGVVLKPMHQNYRFMASARTRKFNEEIGVTKGTKKDPYSGYLTDLSNLYKVHPSTIRLFRDYFTRLGRIGDRFPTFVQGVKDALPQGEAARNLNSSRVLKAVFESLVRGQVPEHEALDMFKARLVEAATSEKPRVPRAQIRLNQYAPATSVKELDKVLTLLSHLTFQIHDYQNFELTEPEGREFLARLSESTTELTGFRKRLQAAMTQASPSAKEED